MKMKTRFLPSPPLTFNPNHVNGPKELKMEHSEHQHDAHEHHAMQPHPNDPQQDERDKSMQAMEHMGYGTHTDHTGHEQMFRQRFWRCLILTIPVLLFSPMLHAGLRVGELRTLKCHHIEIAKNTGGIQLLTNPHKH